MVEGKELALRSVLLQPSFGVPLVALPILVEPPGEAQLSVDEAACVESDGRVAVLFENLRKRQDFVVEHVDLAAVHDGKDPVDGWVQRGEHRHVRLGCLGRRAVRVLEHDRVRREAVEVRAGVSRVAVESEMIGGQRIDRDQHDIEGFGVGATQFAVAPDERGQQNPIEPPSGYT